MKQNERVVHVDMKKTYLTLLLLLIFPFFVGCASGLNPGFPGSSYDEDEEIKKLKDTFDISNMIEEYYKDYLGEKTVPSKNETEDGGKEKEEGEEGEKWIRKKVKRTPDDRNKIITTRLLLIDKLYNRFVARVAAEKQGVDTFTDIAVIGVDLAVATVGGESTKEALGAISAGITGSKLSIDKNYYFEKTISVLITAMNAQRKVALYPIKDGMKKPLEGYSLAEALSDLDSYYFAGTFIGALESINEDAGAKGKKAKVRLEILRDKSFFEKDRQVKVDKILDMIIALEPERALEIIKKPPVENDKANELINLQDPLKKRFTDGEVAKEMLKVMAAMSERSDENLKKWEDAFK